MTTQPKPAETEPKKRTITGRKAIRVQPEDTTRPEREF